MPDNDRTRSRVGHEGADVEDKLTQRDIAHLTNTLKQLDTTVKEFRQEIRDTYVRQDIYDLTMKDLREDVDGHSEIFTWVGRIVVGAVIVALLALVVTSGGTR